MPSTRDRHHRKRRRGPVAKVSYALDDWRTRLEVIVDWRSRMPDFLILGTPKGGTTSIHHWLEGSPALVSAHRKEVGFFTTYYGRGPRWYATHFPRRRPGTQHFESTPQYLEWPETPVRVRDLLPGCRFVVLLRDPVHRAISHYHHRVRLTGDEGPIDATFARELADPMARVRERAGPRPKLAYLYAGHYADHLERWFAHFPRERFFIAASERAWDPDDPSTHHDLARWLGVEPPPGSLPRARATSGEPPSDELVERLRAYYEPHNARLAALLDWRPDWA